jgi:DNA-binding protein YbaB
MFDKMKQMLELKRKADQMKKEMESEIFEVEVGDIKVRVNGIQKIQRLEYPPDTNPDKLKDAINKAYEQSQKEMAKRMQSSMGLGGIQDMLKG